MTNERSDPQSEPLRPVRDLAGTPVADAGGLHIGAVYGSLIQADSGLIRYLDLALEGEDRHVLVPIGHTRVRRDGAADGVEFRLRAATLEDLEAIPPFTPDADLDDTFQEEVLGLHGRVYYGERYYAHPAFDHTGLYAGEHPLVRGPSAPIGQRGIHPLSELAGYHVADDQPDVRGWPVFVAEREPYGRVSDLLVDPEREKVRYALVEPDGGKPAVAVPVGYVTLDAAHRCVHAPALRDADLDALPAYGPSAFDREAEEEIRHVLEARLTGPRRYQRPDFAGGRHHSDEAPQ